MILRPPRLKPNLSQLGVLDHLLLLHRARPQLEQGVRGLAIAVTQLLIPMQPHVILHGGMWTSRPPWPGSVRRSERAASRHHSWSGSGRRPSSPTTRRAARLDRAWGLWTACGAMNHWISTIVEGAVRMAVWQIHRPGTAFLALVCHAIRRGVAVQIYFSHRLRAPRRRSAAVPRSWRTTRDTTHRLQRR